LQPPGPPTSNGVGTSFGAELKSPQGPLSAQPIQALSNTAVAPMRPTHYSIDKRLWEISSERMSRSTWSTYAVRIADAHTIRHAFSYSSRLVFWEDLAVELSDTGPLVSPTSRLPWARGSALFVGRTPKPASVQRLYSTNSSNIAVGVEELTDDANDWTLRLDRAYSSALSH